jgi:hypothetical protein
MKINGGVTRTIHALIEHTKYVIGQYYLVQPPGPP